MELTGPQSLKRLSLRFLAVLSLGAFSVSAGVITVTDLSDTPSAPAPGTLRKAIQDAVPGDTVDFAAGLTGSITLGGSSLVIDKDLTISGPGAAVLEISGNQKSRVFSVAAGVSASVSGLKISNGVAPWNPPDSVPGAGDGGGVLNCGNLSISDCNFTNNHAGFGAGGISNYVYGSPIGQVQATAGGPGGSGGAIANTSGASLTIQRCLFTSNTAGDGGNGGYQGSGFGREGGAAGHGGAIANRSSLAGAIEVADSTFTANSAGSGGSYGGSVGGSSNKGGDGGAIYSITGGVTLTGCTFSGNAGGKGSPGASPSAGTISILPGAGGSGGGLALFGNGMCLLKNCTLSGNRAGTGGSYPGAGTPGLGGGLYGDTHLALVSCTSANSSLGAGIHWTSIQSYAATLRNTIVADGLTGAFVSQGHNLVNSTAGSTGIVAGVNGDLVSIIALGTLADNGGPTPTLLPLGLSPALDHGDDTLDSTDQRGLPRLFGSHVDIGAVELQDHEGPAGVIEFVQAASSVSEDAGAVVVAVHRTGGLSSEQTVAYTTAYTQTIGESAYSPIDFIATSGTLTFAVGETEKSITIPIVQDTLSENPESFLVQLSNPGGGAILGTYVTHTVTIVSDEPPPAGIISFAAASSSIAETAGSVIVTVQRTNAFPAGESVHYQTASGSATSGADFTATSGTLTFAAGEAQKTISIPIVNDAVVESDESFTVVLSNASGGASLGGILTHTVTIQSDDVGPPVPGVIGFASASSVFAESIGNASIVVTRSGGLPAGETVQYQTVAGSATSGADFTATSGTLTFAAGETQKSIIIPIINDSLVENDETFTVTLSVPGGGATLGTPVTQTVTIQSDDVAPPAPGLIGFASASSAFAESIGNASIVVTRTGGLLAGETVQYQTAAGSATSGADFTATSGTLTFAAGETQKTISIPIVNDAVVEPDESFTVVLSNAGGGASLNGPHSHTITIQGEDPPSFLNAGYHGLARRVDAPGWGALILNTTTLGGFTGTLQIENRTFRINGIFNAQGHSQMGLSVSANRSPSLPLVLDLSPDSMRITGTFTGLGGASFELTAERDAMPTSASPLLQTGRYTALLDADLDGPVRGFFAAEVLSSGRVNLTGMLPDATGLSLSTSVRNDGTIALYKPLYPGGHGYLVGTTTLGPGGGLTVTSNLTWHKSKVTRGLYAAGFGEVPVQVSGARYAKRALRPPLDDFDATHGAGSINFAGGELNASFASSLRLLPTRAVFALPNTVRATLTVNPTTGVISGGFIHSDGHKRTYKGACIQLPGTDLAGGVFPGTSTAGTFTLSAGAP